MTPWGDGIYPAANAGIGSGLSAAGGSWTKVPQWTNSSSKSTILNIPQMGSILDEGNF